MSRVQKLAVGSIFVGIVVLGLKTLAWWLTGSLALLSDALESTVNVVTAVAALVAIRIAARPADAGHPYGHHKAELLSAILEGVMIVVAALLIFRAAYYGFLDPRPIDAPMEGLLINGGAAVVNAAWCRVLIVQGRRLRSPALVADGKHLLSDVISSVAVIVGVLATVISGVAQMDAVLAALVAVNILWSGWKLLRDSMSGLLDESLPESTLAAVREIISAHAREALEAHDLRTRHAGTANFIEFHLVVHGNMTVVAAHDLCDRIEAALKARVPDCVVTIHVEPENKVKHTGIVVL